VGKAKDLKVRVSSYFLNSNSLLGKTKILVSQIDKIRITKVQSELESLLLEAFYIKKYRPKYNARLTDGKAYPLIRITIKDKYPVVLIARQENDPNSLYFGPYPNAKDVRIVLKLLRRIFPFQTVLNHPKKRCLYNHLNLCICPPVFDSYELKRIYKKNIKHLIQLLKGKRIKVVHDLQKERDIASQSERFEEASRLQKQISAIEYVSSKVHGPLEYVVNPNLSADLRDKEISSLITELNTKGVMVNKLYKIECFDISNTSGKNAVGSMVVFINGEKDSSLYRRFKIYMTKDTPNDFAMIAEVLKRRFKHDEWKFPDLIIIDGGKGQVSSAMKALSELNLTIPIIGLAKRQETIITSDFKEISLAKDSEAIHLMMRIRDEAHRFAITYHRKLRSRITFS